MKPISYAEQYQAEGFVVLRGCLDVGHLTEARAVFERAFAEGVYKTAPHSSPHIINNIYAFYPRCSLGLSRPE